MIHFSERLKLVNDTRHRVCKEKDKEIERLKKLVFDTRETIKHILIVFKRPVKGTTKEDCYDALEKLQKLYDTNGFITTEEFLDRIEKGE